MYDFIRGPLISLTPTYAVVEAGGIGYKLLVPINLLGRGLQLGSTVQLFTTLVIREQAHTLIGFYEVGERDIFDKLIALSGIGPKTALSLIGHLGLQGLQQAVATGQSSLFAKVPGIGKKTAEKLLIELRGKVEATPIMSGPLSIVHDALQALLNLGYSEPVAHRALTLAEKELGSQEDLSKLIASAIRLSKAVS